MNMNSRWYQSYNSAYSVSHHPYVCTAENTVHVN